MSSGMSPVSARCSSAPARPLDVTDCASCGSAGGSSQQPARRMRDQQKSERAGGSSRVFSLAGGVTCWIVERIGDANAYATCRGRTEEFRRYGFADGNLRSATAHPRRARSRGEKSGAKVRDLVPPVRRNIRLFAGKGGLASTKRAIRWQASPCGSFSRRSESMRKASNSRVQDFGLRRVVSTSACVVRGCGAPRADRLPRARLRSYTASFALRRILRPGNRSDTAIQTRTATTSGLASASSGRSAPARARRRRDGRRGFAMKLEILAFERSISAALADASSRYWDRIEQDREIGHLADDEPPLRASGSGADRHCRARPIRA